MGERRHFLPYREVGQTLYSVYAPLSMAGDLPSMVRERARITNNVTVVHTKQQLEDLDSFRLGYLTANLSHNPGEKLAADYEYKNAFHVRGVRSLCRSNLVTIEEGSMHRVASINQTGIYQVLDGTFPFLCDYALNYFRCNIEHSEEIVPQMSLSLTILPSRGSVSRMLNFVLNFDWTDNTAKTNACLYCELGESASLLRHCKGNKDVMRMFVLQPGLTERQIVMGMPFAKADRLYGEPLERSSDNPTTEELGQHTSVFSANDGYRVEVVDEHVGTKLAIDFSLHVHPDWRERLFPPLRENSSTLPILKDQSLIPVTVSYTDTLHCN